MKTDSLSELLSLRNKTSLITGGAQGIGAQIADRLAEAGSNIALFDLNSEKAIEQARALAAKYQIKAKGYGLNISAFDSIGEIFKQFINDFGKADVLVNNAGVYPMMSIRDIKETDFDFLMNINLKGTFLFSQRIIENMISTNTKGVIINIASTAALKTAGNSAHYVASKHALAGLTKSQAAELGQFGIRSVAIAPTLVNTPGTQKLRENSAVDTALKEFESRLPLKRMAEPDDIAKAVVFAASGLANYITGIVIPVDGGETSL